MTAHGSTNTRVDTKLALRRAKEIYDRATDPLQKRRVYSEQLRALLFAEPFRRWGEAEGLTTPLFNLLDALNSLDLGTVEAELRPLRMSHRPSSARAIRLRAVAAAISILLMRAGWSAAAADGWVAQQLNQLGYKTPTGRKKITPGTVGGWRKEVREGEPGNPLSVATADLLQIMSDVEPAKIEAAAARFMSNLPELLWLPGES